MKKKILIGTLILAVLFASLVWGITISQNNQAEPVADVGQIEEIQTAPPEETEQPPVETEKPSVKEKDEIPEETLAATAAPTATPEPAKEEEESSALTCTLSVRCDEVLNNLEDLHEEKRERIPPDGILFGAKTVEFSEGESVFDVLLREMKSHNIPLAYNKNPLYHSVYIRGIGNLYERDCGNYSGWMYRVNGKSPTYGCSQYQVKPGDCIVFYYSCS